MRTNVLDLTVGANRKAILPANLKEITKTALLYVAIRRRNFLKIADFKISLQAV
jgi:hypothetical protein